MLLHPSKDSMRLLACIVDSPFSSRSSMVSRQLAQQDLFQSILGQKAGRRGEHGLRMEE